MWKSPVVLTVLVALGGPALAGTDDPFFSTPRPEKVQLMCTIQSQRQCSDRLAACAGSPGSSRTSCCAEWTMCLNAYHCNAAGLHCSGE
jgi:hypothetical protein